MHLNVFARALVALAFVPCAAGAARLAVEPEAVLAKSDAKLLSAPTKLVVSPNAASSGGSATALSFDLALLGAPQDGVRGAVHVYVRQPDGTFSFARRLVAPDGSDGDGGRFGSALALDGDRLVVGAPGNLGNGAAYVFRHTGSGAFAYEQKLVAADGAPGDDYGIAVAVRGDTLAVGARLGNSGAINGGAVYVYTRPSTTFTQQQKITADLGAVSQEGASFGSAIALLTDHLYVGAPFQNFGEGALFKYTRSGGTWSFATSRNSGTQPSQFGTSVAATPGFQIYVGAPNGESLDSPGSIAGFVFAYDDSGGGLVFVAHVENPPDIDSRFGSAIAADERVLVVASPGFDGGGSDSGEVHHYAVDAIGAEPSLRQRIVANDAAADDKYGASVATFGGSLLIGAPGSDAGAVDAGAGYVYDTAVEESNLVDPGGGPADLFGNAIAIAGNVKLVGTPHASAAGQVEVYFRDGTTWTKAADDIRLDDAIAESEQFFGAAVAMSDDTTVVVVGAPNFDLTAGDDNTGRAFVFHRQGDVWLPGDVLDAVDGLAGDRFGASVAISPDGRRIVVGAPDKGVGDTGGIYVFEDGFAGASDAKRAAGATFGMSGSANGSIGDKFGASVAVDDAGTVAVGVPLRGSDDRGAVDVLRDFGGGFVTETLDNPGGAAGDHFGTAVSLRNGELVAGVPNADRPGQPANDDAGAAMMFDVGTTASTARGLVQPADLRIGDKFGSSVGISDGIAIVGAPLRDVEAAGGIMRPNAGSARMLLRQAGAWLVDAEIVASDRADDDNFGAAVAIRARTLTAGAPLNDAEASNFEDQGASYIFRIGAREPVLYADGFE